MPNVFTGRANFIARLSIVVVILGLTLVGGFAYGYIRSAFYTGVGVEVSQPVPFSHSHHVQGLGIDCRYCHTTAETSAFAGLPTTQTCMNCHSKVWVDAPMLEPVRESWRTQTPLRWERVHNLPDFVYFAHSIHLAKGIGCASCHGRVDEMRLMRKEASLFMQWCLDCHRNPAPHLRPTEALFSMDWQPPDDGGALAGALLDHHQIQQAAITDCSTCYR